MADRVGQQLGNYLLVALLGQGGYAEVYLGQHVRFKQQAAIKVLHAYLSEQEAQHFQQEAETIATLAHPGIIRVLDFDVKASVPYLVMDYAPNGSLRQRYPKGSLVPLPVIISMVKQVAEALQYAHEQKFIHRDVKPENMLVGRRQEVLLSDFGIATIVHSTYSLSTSAEGTSGTLAYMAPEQIEGHPRPASDQYALAVVVYEWLCGERPFEGSVSELIAQQLSMPPPLLHEHVPAIPDEVEQVVLRALAKDPKQRFASVQDFALALKVASTADSPGSTRPMLASESASEARLMTKHHLPAYLTPLLGRGQEIGATCDLLRREEVRLLALTGPGGIGKTRLAVQLATELLADFVDGAYFVSLAPLSDFELVIPAIAQTLEVKESGALPLMDILKAFLKDKYLLLVIDNFEQLLPASPQLADLLTSCPHLKLLVTSRAALHLQGEHEFLVPPLAVPDLTHLPEQEVLSQYAAVALFLQHAQAVKPAFNLTIINARPIAEICARLDGLPLAIELAAARIKLLPPLALLARLSQRLAVLTSGAKDAPVRQQTLRNTIAWSYDLLDATEQRLFRRLSVFVGGCTLEAVEAVCTAPGDRSRARAVLDGVSSLIDKSLLQPIEQAEEKGEEPRFVVLETIREYGLEALEVSGEMEAIRQAHALYYLRLAEQGEPELRGPQQAVWLERLEWEHDNLRAAMQWSLERGEAGHSMETALRLGGTLALLRLWLVRGPLSEGRSFLERALARSEGAAVTVRAKALEAAANLASFQDDTDRAKALFEGSLALYRELEDKRGMAASLFWLGEIASRKNDLTRAHVLISEGLTLQREVGDKEGTAWSLFGLAALASVQGEYANAHALYEEGLSIHRQLGNKHGVEWSLFRLAEVIFVSQGDQTKVHALLEEGLAFFRELGDKDGFASSCQLRGRLALSQGDAAAARSSLEESARIYRELGHRLNTAESLSLLARVEARLGAHARAHAHSEESLALAREVGKGSTIAFTMEGLAGVVLAQGDPSWAARLLSAAESLRMANGTPLPPVERADYERLVATARTLLGQATFATAWAEGRTMTLEQALASSGPVAVPDEVASPAQPIYPAGLTAREVEVLRLVAQGLTDAQVAEQLIISPRTVNWHLTSIYSKIGVSSRSAATRYAIEQKLL
jgi:predicted ATPase/DNA-binding CsgD family transcriptional regulator/tRNA A-37 threonylcarbamoyl transferase component Bud32